MTSVWLDLRGREAQEVGSYVQLAIERGVGGVVVDEDPQLSALHRNGIEWVSFPSGKADGAPGPAYIHVFPMGSAAAQGEDGRTGVAIEVTDKPSLDAACAAVRGGRLTVVRFADPTKIPLEIVLAAGFKRDARLMTFVSDLEEAEVVKSVLESGPDGVILAPASVDQVVELARICQERTPVLPLKEFMVEEIQNAGTGDRACVDTCSNFAEDEGILVGSFASGFLLCCSETHPLPYMPTRPFRVNAGAVSCYVFSSPERTNYLSELRQGDRVLGVNVKGETRELVMNRAKIETRPLILVRARAADGDRASIILQNDWHVRMLGPGGHVLNVTELKPGDRLLGHGIALARHVGMPLEEYLLEQ